MTNAVTTKRGRIFGKYGGKCAYCGCGLTYEDFQVDHIFSKNYFKERKELVPNGFVLSSEKNLNPACNTCNSYKNESSVEEFRTRIEKEYQTIRNIPKVKIAERFGVVVIKAVSVVFYFEKHNSNGTN